MASRKRFEFDHKRSICTWQRMNTRYVGIESGGGGGGRGARVRTHACRTLHETALGWLLTGVSAPSTFSCFSRRSLLVFLLSLCTLCAASFCFFLHSTSALTPCRTVRSISLVCSTALSRIFPLIFTLIRNIQHTSLQVVQGVESISTCLTKCFTAPSQRIVVRRMGMEGW